MGHKVPNKNTYISRNHGIYLDEDLIQERGLKPQIHKLIHNVNGKKLVRARNLVNGKDIIELKKEGDILYNVLMDEHSTMIVNNMICETLNPHDTDVQAILK